MKSMEFWNIKKKEKRLQNDKKVRQKEKKTSKQLNYNLSEEIYELEKPLKKFRYICNFFFLHIKLTDLWSLHRAKWHIYFVLVSYKCLFYLQFLYFTYSFIDFFLSYSADIKS